jgi:hypothetical protein
MIQVTDRKLFGTNKLIEDFVKRLTKVHSHHGGWTTEYVDIETGQHWLKYVVDDRGFFENLIHISPKPTTDELIDIAFSSPYPDGVSAAATRLNLEEQEDKKEFREKLLDRLKKIDISNLDKGGKDRIETIIKASQLTDRVNKRDIIGKYFSDIQKDAAFFTTTADRAKEILNML